MAFLSALALILLTLVGYASGATLAGRGKNPLPVWTDIVAVVALWAAAFALRPTLGRWGTIAFFLLLGLAVGYFLLHRRLVDKPTAPPVSELPEHARPVETRDGSIFRRAWQAWSHFALEMGNFQGRLLMAFFYFIVITPFATPMRFLSDPMEIHTRPESSAWREKEPVDLTLDTARRQG